MRHTNTGHTFQRLVATIRRWSGEGRLFTHSAGNSTARSTTSPNKGNGTCGFPAHHEVFPAVRRNSHHTFTVVRFINAPASLVSGLWSAVNPLHGYFSSTDVIHSRDHAHEVWSLVLLKGEEDFGNGEEDIGCHAPGHPHGFLPAGRVAIRATGHHRCRLTLQMEFPGPADATPRGTVDSTVAQVSRIKSCLDRFTCWFDHGIEHMEESASGGAT